jgi:hypothetical protein
MRNPVVEGHRGVTEREHERSLEEDNMKSWKEIERKCGLQDENDRAHFELIGLHGP